MMQPLELSSLHLPLTTLCQIHPKSILECYRVVFPTTTNSNRVSITFDFVKPKPLLQPSSKTISLPNSINRNSFSSKRARKNQASAGYHLKEPQPTVIPTSAGNLESFNRHSGSPLSTASPPIIPTSNESSNSVSSHAKTQISNTSLPASQGETKYSQQPNSSKTVSPVLISSPTTSNNFLKSLASRLVTLVSPEVSSTSRRSKPLLIPSPSTSGVSPQSVPSISSTIGTRGSSGSSGIESTSTAVSAVSAAVPPQPPVIFDFFAPVNDDGGSRQDSFFATQSSSPSEQHPSAADSSALSVQHSSPAIKTSSSLITVNGDGGVNGRRFHRSKRRFAAKVDSSAALLQPLNKEGGHGSVSVSQSSSSYTHPNPFELLSSTDSSLVLTEQASPSTPSNDITPAVSTTIIPSSTSRGLAPLPRRTHEQRSASTSALSIRNGGYRDGRRSPPHPPPHTPSSLLMKIKNQLFH